MDTHGWYDLSVATWNTGPAHIEDARGVLKQADVMAMQEASDQDRMIAALRKDGYGVIRPEQHIGQPATPLVWNKDRLHLIRSFSISLYEGGDIGPGTGPDHGKPKWLNGGYFVDKVSGRHLAFSSMHTYAGERQGPHENLRQRISEDMVATAGRHFRGYHGLPFILGDFNSEPDTGTLSPLRHSGWTCDHLVLGMLVTHEPGWTPDHVWGVKGDERYRFGAHHVIRNRSDHHADVVDLLIRPRRASK